MSIGALKRYDDTVDDGMREFPDGEWVRLADVQALFRQEQVDMLTVFASPPDLPAYGPLLELAGTITALIHPQGS